MSVAADTDLTLEQLTVVQTPSCSPSGVTQLNGLLFITCINTNIILVCNQTTFETIYSFTVSGAQTLSDIVANYSCLYVADTQANSVWQINVTSNGYNAGVFASNLLYANALSIASIDYLVVTSSYTGNAWAFSQSGTNLGLPPLSTFGYQDVQHFVFWSRQDGGFFAQFHQDPNPALNFGQIVKTNSILGEVATTEGLSGLGAGGSIDPRYIVLGTVKSEEIVIVADYVGSRVLVFDQQLSGVRILSTPGVTSPDRLSFNSNSGVLTVSSSEAENVYVYSLSS